MGETKLNKRLFTDVNRLKLCNTSGSPVRFLLEQSPFKEDGEQEETGSSADLKEIVIIGRIYPTSEIYREGAFQIEMKLTSNYPLNPPEVRFLTPIYHPNVGKDGKFCHDLLKKTAQWTPTKTLVDVVKAIADHIDKPDIDYSLSLELGKEYMENRAEFNRKALESVKKSALPRN